MAVRTNTAAPFLMTAGHRQLRWTFLSALLLGLLPVAFSMTSRRLSVCSSGAPLGSFYDRDPFALMTKTVLGCKSYPIEKR